MEGDPQDQKVVADLLLPPPLVPPLLLHPPLLPPPGPLPPPARLVVVGVEQQLAAEALMELEVALLVEVLSVPLAQEANLVKLPRKVITPAQLINMDIDTPIRKLVIIFSINQTMVSDIVIIMAEASILILTLFPCNKMQWD